MNNLKTKQSTNLGLLENGLEFFYDGIMHLANKEYEDMKEHHSSMKYVLLHLSSGIELILKSRLQNEHWTLIFEKLSQANRSNLRSGDFLSINLEQSISRLQTVCEIKFSVAQKKLLTEFKKERNKVEHYHYKINVKKLKEKVASVIDFIIDFLDLNFRPEWISKKSNGILQNIIGWLSLIDEFTHLRYETIKERISKKGIILIICPSCFEETFDLKNRKCAFCTYTNTPHLIAKRYEDVAYENLTSNINYEHKLSDCKYCNLKKVAVIKFEVSSDLKKEEKEKICFNCYDITPYGQVKL